jgi:hypothetical protein
VKQCQELEDSAERAECKGVYKNTRDNDKDNIDFDQDSALDVCEGEFEAALFNDCLGLAVP